MRQSKAARDVLARIGASLIQIQRTELTINFCIKSVVPKRVKLSKDLFSPDGRRQPLGRLIAELHRQVIVPKTFEKTLKEFLHNRNSLVHQIEFIPNWTLQHDRGIIVAHAFLDHLDSLEREVRNVFYALLEAWKLDPHGTGQPMSDKAYQQLTKSLFPKE